MVRPVAVVTGAGSGIGRAAALALAGGGFDVALIGRRREPLDGVAVEIKRTGAAALVLLADVTDEAAIDQAFAAIVQARQRVDVLFNNAGIGLPGLPIDQIPVAEWRRGIDVNLTGMFICTRAAFRIMKEQSPRGGRIINNGSISAHAPRPNSATYTAAKHAVTGLTRSTALDGRPHDIACGQIDIGNAATQMTARMSEGVLQADGSIATEPLLDVALVGQAVLQMASLPLSANIQFMTIMATKMPFIGRG
jgi:NAD(P)-dependent dehydrogenase (short-subunit alcohol dehydrogenase family)